MAIRFGPDWQDELWASPYRLRFELGQGEGAVNRFTSAYDRARRLARAALPAERVVAVVAAYPSRPEPPSAMRRGRTGRTAYEALDEMGTRTRPSEAAWMGFAHPGEAQDPEARPWKHRAISITWDEADVLLWNQIAQEIGVAPRAPVLATLVDVERGVSVHAYDDRGMDITALSPDPIAHLRMTFDAWLLDHDRPRMSEAFGV